MIQRRSPEVVPPQIQPRRSRSQILITDDSPAMLYVETTKGLFKILLRTQIELKLGCVMYTHIEGKEDFIVLNRAGPYGRHFTAAVLPPFFGNEKRGEEGSASI